MTIREILLRKLDLNNKKLTIILVLGLILGVSASYELAEELVALAAGGAEAFVGLQEDILDTHWDMFIALIGAISGLLSLSSTHNKSLALIKRTTKEP